MNIGSGFGGEAKDYQTRREDLAFIVRFDWKSSTHLKEAIRLLTEANAAAASPPSSADNEQTTISKASVLEHSEYRRIRLIIATNPNTPPAVLAYLARDVDDVAILERIAENPRTPIYTLVNLAHSRHAVVRAAVAENLNCDIQVLTVLQNDPDADVRYRLAENPHVPVEVLLALLDDSNPYVHHRAVATLMRLAGGTLLTAKFGQASCNDEDDLATNR